MYYFEVDLVLTPVNARPSGNDDIRERTILSIDNSQTVAVHSAVVPASIARCGTRQLFLADSQSTSHSTKMELQKQLRGRFDDAIERGLRKPFFEYQY